MSQEFEEVSPVMTLAHEGASEISLIPFPSYMFIQSTNIHYLTKMSEVKTFLMLFKRKNNSQKQLLSIIKCLDHINI